MLNKLRVRNFKCLQDVTLELGPLTALIGTNDSGKTSVLEAINLLGAFAAEASSNGVRLPPQLLSKLIWRGDLQRSFQWEAEGSEAERRFLCELKLSPSNGLAQAKLSLLDGIPEHMRGISLLPSEETPLTPLHHLMQASGPYSLQPAALKRGAPPAPAPVLSASGDNLAAVVDAILTGPDRETALALERSIKDAIPTLRGISLRTLAPSAPSDIPGGGSRGAQTVDAVAAERLPQTMKLLTSMADTQPAGPGVVKVIDFVLAGKERPPVVVPASQTSDGALLITAFLALAHSDSPPILLIEEPENGFHPSRMQQVVDLLRRISRGEVGPRPRQVVLTSHSPILLNCLDPEEVRIVHRDSEGAAQITPLTQAPRIRELLQEFAIGELWYALHEEGLLRGEAP